MEVERQVPVFEGISSVAPHASPPDLELGFSLSELVTFNA